MVILSGDIESQARSLFWNTIIIDDVALCNNMKGAI